MLKIASTEQIDYTAFNAFFAQYIKNYNPIVPLKEVEKKKGSVLGIVAGGVIVWLIADCLVSLVRYLMWAFQ